MDAKMETLTAEDLQYCNASYETPPPGTFLFRLEFLPNLVDALAGSAKALGFEAPHWPAPDISPPLLFKDSEDDLCVLSFNTFRMKT